MSFGRLGVSSFGTSQPWPKERLFSALVFLGTFLVLNESSFRFIILAEVAALGGLQCWNVHQLPTRSVGVVEVVTLAVDVLDFHVTEGGWS